MKPAIPIAACVLLTFFAAPRCDAVILLRGNHVADRYSGQGTGQDVGQHEDVGQHADRDVDLHADHDVNQHADRDADKNAEQEQSAFLNHLLSVVSVDELYPVEIDRLQELILHGLDGDGDGDAKGGMKPMIESLVKLVKTLEDQVNTTHAFDKEAVPKQDTKQFEACQSSYDQVAHQDTADGSEDTSRLQSDFEAKEQAVNGCKENTEMMETPVKDCKELVDSLEDAGRTDCGEANKAKDGDISQCKILPTHKTKTDWLEGMVAFFEMEDKRLKEIVQACAAETSNATAEKTKCTAEENKVQEMKSKCEDNEVQMKNSACAVKLSMTQECTSYKNCYNGARSQYDTFMKGVKNRVTQRKLQWRMLKRLECLVKAYEGGKIDKTKLDACAEKKSYKTDFLNIDCPDAPGMKPCKTEHVPAKILENCPELQDSR